VPQQRAELPHRRRGDPRLREQVRAEQLRQDGGAGPCRSSAAPRRSPCTAAGAPGEPPSRSPPAGRPASPSRTRSRTPSASPKAGPHYLRYRLAGMRSPGKIVIPDTRRRSPSDDLQHDRPRGKIG
jgi:hypothetical protein